MFSGDLSRWETFKDPRCGHDVETVCGEDIDATHISGTNWMHKVIPELNLVKYTTIQGQITTFQGLDYTYGSITAAAAMLHCRDVPLLNT
jgi:hypothetical protein